MESPRCWFVLSDDLPDGEVIVPIKTQHGLAFACRRGELTQQMLDGLNDAAKLVIGVGLASIPDNEREPHARKE
ncbi:hypothetical protein LRR80_05432 [Streptomyces sp. RO-S4]|nr:hypothetical protein [Streptomyces sp. RO-S4]